MVPKPSLIGTAATATLSAQPFSLEADRRSDISHYKLPHPKKL